MDKHAPDKDMPSPVKPEKRPITIGVFCGSSPGMGPEFLATAKRFGTLVGEAGFAFLFGGGRLGLMGEAAIAAHEAGAQVIGIMPDFLRHLEPPLKAAQEEVVFVSSLFDRKQKMTEASDAFVILPGGIGTLDELFEVLVGKQLLVHDKPIIVLNLGGYYDAAIALIEQVIREGFASPNALNLFSVVPDADAAMAEIKAQLARRPPSGESVLQR